MTGVLRAGAPPQENNLTQTALLEARVNPVSWCIASRSLDSPSCEADSSNVFRWQGRLQFAQADVACHRYAGTHISILHCRSSRKKWGKGSTFRLGLIRQVGDKKSCSASFSNFAAVRRLSAARSIFSNSCAWVDIFVTHTRG